ncbi:MAG: efflux RND transporter periplasmic adaptor subunit [Planctomycetes bacterium]|nr:efflux RND transporter periplasmic adaptor subunit [Planctomycetota bacterium]
MTPSNHLRSTAAPSASRRGGALTVILVLLVVAAGAWQSGILNGIFEGDTEVEIDGAPVRTGPLRISEVVRGNLEASDSISLKCEIEGRSTIIFLAEEGTFLNEGDLVVELDVSQLADELVAQEIEVKNAEAAFTKAREQYDIQVIQNESDIAAAELALELAELDLAKYTGNPEANEPGEWDNELAKAEETVLLQEEQLATAEKELTWAIKLHAEEFKSQNELEQKQFAKQRAEVQLGQAKRELDLIVKFGNRRKLAELQSDVDTRRRDISKTEKQAAAKLADFEAERESASFKLNREREQLQELKEQVGKSKIYAPEPGLLVYAREKSRWGSGDTIEEGDEVRERQELCTIPRQGGMTVKASIHETKLKKIQAGLPCLVTVDAFPNRTFEGRVDFVAVMADSGSWRSNPNQRLYKADISLLNPIRDMRPGMSCSVDILVKDLENATYIPRQSVFLDGGKTIVFKRTEAGVERCEVEVGMDNTKWVAIDSGLDEGDVVLLAPPADFEPAPVPDEPAPEIGAGAQDSGATPGARAAGGRGAMPVGASMGGAGRGGQPGGSLTAEQKAEFAKRMRERSAGGSTRGGRGGGGQDR